MSGRVEGRRVERSREAGRVRLGVLVAVLGLGGFAGAFGAHLAGEEEPGRVLPPEMVMVDRTADGLEQTPKQLLLDGSPFSGRVLDRFDDGSLRRTTTYRDGVAAGDEIEWSIDGRIVSWERHAQK